MRICLAATGGGAWPTASRLLSFCCKTLMNQVNNTRVFAIRRQSPRYAWPAALLGGERKEASFDRERFHQKARKRILGGAACAGESDAGGSGRPRGPAGGDAAFAS